MNRETAALFLGSVTRCPARAPSKVVECFQPFLVWIQRVGSREPLFTQGLYVSPITGFGLILRFLPNQRRHAQRGRGPTLMCQDPISTRKCPLIISPSLDVFLDVVFRFPLPWATTTSDLLMQSLRMRTNFCFGSTVPASQKRKLPGRWTQRSKHQDERQFPAVSLDFDASPFQSHAISRIMSPRERTCT